MSKSTLEKLQELFPDDMRKYNSQNRKGKKLCRWDERILKKQLNVNITDKMYRGIKTIVENRLFPNCSEYIRHLIIKDFEARYNNGGL